MNTTIQVRRFGAALCLAALWLNCGGSGDYLSSPVRARVEQLKADVAGEPTSAETLKERTRVLWDWANAYALDGGVIPVELPAVAAIALAWGSKNPLGFDPAAKIDSLVRELQIRDERPGAIGALVNDAGDPLPAASFQTLAQTYTVGGMGMAPGGGLMLAKHFISDHGVFQREDPAADNYVTVSCSKADARFANTTAVMTGMHGGFLSGGRDTLVYQLEGPALEAGDTITITYGDRSGGSQGMLVQTYANDFFPLPVYVDPKGDGEFFTLPIQPYVIEGNEAHAVHGFAPSVVGTGEVFDVSVRSEDLYYNRATGPIPEYEALLNGEPYATIPAGGDAVTVLGDVKFESPGVYRFTFRSTDGQVRGIANPILVAENPRQRVYWGETHAHGGFAEGLGSPDWFFRFARDDARLDFVTLSEHDIWMDDGEWEVLKDAVRRHNEDGRFVVFLGYEWTMMKEQGGHHNVFFRTPDDRRRVSVQRAPTLSDLYLGLHRENSPDDVLIIPHCHMPGDWRLHDPDMERLVEIMSMHGTFEWFGRRYLERGYRIGFVAASDDHLGHPGYTGTTAGGLFQRGGLTAVLAPEKTSDAIFSSLRDISAYATTGERIILDVSVNGTGMGQYAPFAPERRLDGQVVGTAPIDTITVVRNGEEVWCHDYLTERRVTRFVQVEFHSQAEEFFRESPRGWRYWNGTLDVEGADVVSFETPQFRNRYREFIRRDAENSNRLHFATGTRGKASSILLELRNITTGAAIRLDLAAAREIPSTRQEFRPVASIPAAVVRLPFAAATGGRLRRAFQVDRYEDSITLRFLNPEAPMEREFSFVDPEREQRGDYYYVRVLQLDGALAWSSPVWVGGEPPT